MKRRERLKKKKYLASKDTKKQVKTSQTPVEEKENKNSIYYKHYKKLLLIPFIMLLLAIVVLIANTATTGYFINRGISFTGGLEATIINPQVDVGTIKADLMNEFPDNELEVRSIQKEGIITEIKVKTDITLEETAEVERFFSEVEKSSKPLSKDDISKESFGASMGSSFFSQLMVAVIIALVFMGFIVFLYFKSFIPSSAVILAAISDIIVTIAVIDLMGMKVGTAGIAALLMLIGYSVDTDILLSTRVLKNKEGTVYNRIITAMKTGMTMTITTTAAVVVTLMVAEPDVLKEIMTIILIGLIVDIINTWLQNAGIIRWWMEKKESEN